MPRLVAHRGDWIYLRGPNGCGKSSLLKAVAGLWPYGEGRVALAKGARMFFAGQEPDLPDRLTLKELVTYPDGAEACDDLDGRGRARRASASAVHLASSTTSCTRAGTGATCSPAGRSSGWSWRGSCCRSPTSCFWTRRPRRSTPNAATDFHLALRERLPDATIVAVLHADDDPDATPTASRSTTWFSTSRTGSASVRLVALRRFDRASRRGVTRRPKEIAIKTRDAAARSSPE